MDTLQFRSHLCNKNDAVRWRPPVSSYSGISSGIPSPCEEYFEEKF